MNKSDIATWPTRSIAARHLGCSSELVTNLMNQGLLKFIPTKLGRLIDPQSLERVRKGREAKLASRAGLNH
jgi:hypothetical protein